MSKDFFHQLKGLSKAEKYIITTILEQDENLGKRSILAKDEYIYSEGSDVFWQEAKAELSGITKPINKEIAGKRVFAEVMGHSPHIIICGGGHVSLPVAEVAKMLGFKISVIDDRSFFANTARFHMVDNVYCKPFDVALEEIEESLDNYYVIVTRGHAYDQECLRHIINKTSAYVGMIGSRSRVKLVKEALVEEGYDTDKLATVYTPIGLKIGAETPEEIAISIMAEIIQIKSERSANGGFDSDIIDAIEAGKMPIALTSLVGRKGSAPRQIGTKMLVFADGSCVGTIGGGCVEADVRRRALIAIDDAETSLVRVDMTGKVAEDDGMVCGGIVDVLIEKI